MLCTSGWESPDVGTACERSLLLEAWKKTYVRTNYTAWAYKLRIQRHSSIWNPE